MQGAATFCPPEDVHHTGKQCLLVRYHGNNHDGNQTQISDNAAVTTDSCWLYIECCPESETAYHLTARFTNALGSLQ